jgi:hypothetical protein
MSLPSCSPTRMSKPCGILVNEGMGDNTLWALTSDLAYLQAWSLPATGSPCPGRRQRRCSRGEAGEPRHCFDVFLRPSGQCPQFAQITGRAPRPALQRRAVRHREASASACRDHPRFFSNPLKCSLYRCPPGQSAACRISFWLKPLFALPQRVTAFVPDRRQGRTAVGPSTP